MKLYNEETGEIYNNTNFYSKRILPKTKSSITGEEEQTIYKMEIGQDGKKTLVTSGKTNTYRKIQEQATGMDIYSILERYNNGDIEILEKTKGTFGDFTNSPKTLAEAQQLIIDAEKEFEKLPLEIRREFEHSSSQFIKEIGTSNFEEKINKVIKEKNEKYRKSEKPQIKEIEKEIKANE